MQTTQLFPSQTAQTLDLSAQIAPGRTYLLAVVGTAVAFEVQYRMPVAGAKRVMGLTAITPTDVDTVAQVEVKPPTAGLLIKFASNPGTYHVALTVAKNENH